MNILYVAIGLVVGALGVLVAIKLMANNVLAKAQVEAERLKSAALAEAQAKARDVDLANRQEQVKRKEQLDRETEATRSELRNLESRLTKREDTLDRKLDTLSVKEKQLDELESRVAQRDKSLAAKEAQLNQVLHEQRDRLLQLTNLSPEQAKEMLLKRIEEDCKLEAGALIQRITEQAQDEAKEKSRQIVLQAIQRYAAEQTSDHTVSTVTIPSDDMKGRVIGREGRNIRSFEKATGVDVIIDDTPGVVVVSLFRSGAPAGGEIVAGEAGAGWPNPSGADRGSGRGNQQGNGGGAAPHRQGGGPGSEPAIAQADHPDAGAAGVPNQLWAERAEAFDGGGVFIAGDRRRVGFGWNPGAARGVAARHWQGDGSRAGRRASAAWQGTPASLR